MPNHLRAPWLLKFRSSHLFIITTICAAAFTDGFIYAIFVPVLPFSLQNRYHVAPGNVQEWTSGLLGIFGLVVLLGSPIVGWISDGEKSRKSAYTFGLACLVGGVATLAITTHLWMLVISRILQGVSAAVVFTVGLALVADTVDAKDIGYYMGYVLSSMSCGVLMGPLFGSVTFNFAGHFAVVGLMGIIAFADILLRILMVEKSEARKYTSSEDVTERTGLLPGCFQHSQQAPTKWEIFSLLGNPRVATAIYGVFVHVVIIASFDAVLPIFLERVLGWTSLKVAWCFLAIAIPNTILGPLAGKISDTCGPMLPAFSGCILTAVPMILLQLIHQDTAEQVWLLYVLLAAIGTAASLIISPLAADLFYVIETLVSNGDTAAYAQSYGLFTCAMAGGTLVGPVLGGYLKEALGWTAMTWGLGLFVASGAIPVVRKTITSFQTSTI
ncbi:major facilitator superfamily domain-containing protein [Rhexocercosporidium sp. MPI-PUGE-AT-0058]|nr:major facilitator superfamily domain-containing protein [Rhexocercosporidium sp. MPI-PUGE-AT-0058]